MSQDLRILIDSSINVGSSIKNINNDIKALASHPSLKSLNLKVDIDKSFVKAMNEFVSATKVLSHALEQQQKVVNESVKTTKLLDGSIEKVTQKQLANGTIITQTTKKINEETQAYNEQKKTLQQLEKELDGYTLARTRANKNKLGEINSTTNTYKNQAGQQVNVNVDRDGNVKNYSQVTDYLKQQQEALQKEQAINKQREQVAQQEYATRKALADKNLKEEEQRNQQFISQLRTRFAEEQRIARDRDALDRAHSAAITEGLNRQKAVADMQAKITAAQTRFKGNSSAVAELNALNAQLGNVSKVSNYKDALTELQTKLTQITTQAKLAGNEAKTLGERFANAASKVAMWTGATSSIYMTIRALKDMVSVVIEVDSQMTQLKRVMDESTDFEGMLSSSIQLANELGRSITEVNENAIGFARMGFDEDQTMNLAKTSTLLQNISELTPQESVDTLTAAMTIFNVEAGKSIEIANKLNEIDNNFAVTTQNLALAMTKAGSSANTFGVSMERLLGNATAITTATRESGSIVGNSLKSIYSRITSMAKSEDVLNSVGVSMREMNGEVRDVSDILDDLAGRWSGLSKEQQQYTAVQLAGRYQLSRFIALLDNYNISVQATETALHSQGSATRENEKYMQSLEARIQKMKTAWETLSIAFGEAVISDTIITLTSLFASMLNGTVSLVKEFGALPVVLGAVGVGIAILRPKLAALIWDFTKTNIAMLATSPASAVASLGMKALAGAATVARGAVTALKFALKALLASTIIGGAFVLLGSALEWIVGKFSDATTATEDFTDKTEELNEKQYDLSNLKSLSSEYDELAKKTELSFEEKSRLAQIESELSSKYNVTTTTIDGQTKSYQENNEAIKTQIGLREDELKAARLAAEIEYNSNADKIDKDIEREKNALLEREKAYDDALAAYEANKKEWAKYDPVTQSYEYGMGKSANESLAAKLKEESKLLTDSKTSLQTAMNAKVLAYKSASQSFIDEQEANNVKVKGLTRQFMDIYARAAAESGVSDDKLKSNLGGVFRSIQSKDLANAEEGINLLKQMPGIMNLTSTSYKDMMAAMSQYSYSPVVEGVESLDGAFNDFNLTLEETVERTDEMSQKISEAATFVSETKKEISVLNTAQEELAKGNRLSTDTIKKMNDKYEDFIKVTGLSKDAIKKYVAAKKEERISVVNEEINKTKTTIEETKKRIKAYEIEMAAWESRRKVETSAKIDELNAQLEAGLINEQQAEQMFGVYRRNQSGVDSKGNVINNATTSAYAMERVALKDLMADLSLLESAKNDLTIASNESSKATNDATKSNDKSKESYTDSYEILTKTQKKLLELADAIKKVQSERNMMVKGSKQYIDSLKEEKKLVEQQIAAQEKALKNPSELVSTKIKTTTTTTPSDTSSPTSSSTSSNSGTKLDSLLSNALGLQGKFTYKQVSGKFKGTYDQFVKGAISDCSQFVQEMFDEFLGINLPRTAAEQAKQGVSVQKADLKKGDLVFFNTTGKANSHVGIYTGNGKFIQMGNSGLKEQSLDSSYWAPKYQGAKRINGVGEASSLPTADNSSASKTKTTSSDGKTVTETTKATQKELEDAVRDTKADILSGKSQVYQLGLDIVEAVIAGTDNQIAKLQAKRDLSSNKQSRFTQDSAEWRKEEMSQSSLLQQEQKLIEQQNKDIRQQLMEQKITQGEYDAKIAENSAKWWDYQSQIDEKRKNVFDSQLSAYDKQIKTDDDALAISEAKLKSLKEGTVEYTKELQSQIPVLEHKSSVLAKEIEYTKSLIANNKNNAVLTAYYKDRLQELNVSLLDSNSALIDLNKTLKDMRDSAADIVIDDYKKAIETRRDLELDALDKVREKEDKRHDEAVKNIEKEQKKTEDYINARLKAYDRENSSTDYTEELTKKMDERQKIQNQINSLSADNSMAGKAKRKELQEQLVTIDEEIRKFQRDRERELVKQGLQDQLDDSKNYNDKIKTEEDKLHDDTVKKYDDEKKAIERKYKDILENQKHFYDLKKGLMSNDATVVTATLGIINGEYDKLFANIKDHTFETSQAMQNMITDAQTSLENLNKFRSGDYTATEAGSGGNGNNTPSGSSNSTGTIKGTMASRQAWTEYLSNKQQAESLRKEMARYEQGSIGYNRLEKEFNQLKTKNDQLRSVYNFPDGSYKDLVTQKIFSAETGGMTPAGIGKEGKFLLAHEKELVLNKSDTSNVLKIVNVARDMFDRFKSSLNLNSISPRNNPAPSSTDNSVHIEKVEIHATDKDTGSSLLNKFETALNNKMKLRTI